MFSLQGDKQGSLPPMDIPTLSRQLSLSAISEQQLIQSLPTASVYTVENVGSSCYASAALALVLNTRQWWPHLWPSLTSVEGIATIADQMYVGDARQLDPTSLVKRWRQTSSGKVSTIHDPQEFLEWILDRKAAEPPRGHEIGTVTRVRCCNCDAKIKRSTTMETAIFLPSARDKPMERLWDDHWTVSSLQGAKCEKCGVLDQLCTESSISSPPTHALVVVVGAMQGAPCDTLFGGDFKLVGATLWHGGHHSALVRSGEFGRQWWHVEGKLASKNGNDEGSWTIPSRTRPQMLLYERL